MTVDATFRCPNCDATIRIVGLNTDDTAHVKCAECSSPYTMILRENGIPKFVEEFKL